MLAGCVGLLPTESEIAERNDIKRYDLRVAIQTQILDGDTNQTRSFFCDVVIHSPHYKQYGLDEVVGAVEGFEQIRELPRIENYRVCYEFAVGMRGYIVNVLAGVPFGTITYRMRREGWQHAVNLLYTGGQLWLIDPRSKEVYRFDKVRMEAYAIVF